jgi:RNA polymerase sigma factor (TIGR02999 family)
MNEPGPQLLESLRTADKSALNTLVAVLYKELRRIAARHLRQERAAHTLQATALVHEVYLKLIGNETVAFADRAHFLAIASRVMRQVLVDHARSRGARKRGGSERVQLSASEGAERLEISNNTGDEQIEILDLDGALEALAEEDQSLARLIEMRYFGGMTAEETAEVLGESVHVVRHNLRLAHAWLRRKLND